MKRAWLAIAGLAVVGATVGALLADRSGSPAAAIRDGIRRFAREPAVIYPICVSTTDSSYAKVSVYPLPVDSSFRFEAIVHHTKAGWRVVARQYGYDGWLALSSRHMSRIVEREPWCRSVPQTPAAIRAVLSSKLAAVSTFGLTNPYVPVEGGPLYEPMVLGYSGDGGAFYDVERWLTYGRTSARARATWDYNPCTPDCATGHPRKLVHFVMTLTLPKPCRGVVAYTRLAVSESSDRRLFPDTAWSLGDFCR